MAEDVPLREHLEARITELERYLETRIDALAASSVASLQDRIDRLEEAQTSRTGRRTGLAAGWAYLLAAVGLIGTVVAVLVVIVGD